MATTKNMQYWEKRAEELEEHVFSDTKEFEKALDVVYRANIQDIDNQINGFLTKYVDQEGVLTYSEAVKNLTKDEKQTARSVLNTLNARYRRTKDPELLARIKKLSAQQLKTRLDSVKLQIEAQLSLLATDTNMELEEFLTQVYEDTYLESTATYAEGLGVVNEFDTVNFSQIKEVVRYPYSGSLFSDNVWASTDKLNKALTSTLMLGLGQGKSIDKLSKEIKERLGMLGVNKNSYTNYDIRRVVRTETKFIQERAKADANKKYGFTKYKVFVNVNERTCPRCKEFIDKVYSEDARKAGINSPPFHPQCRCTSVPYYEEVKRAKKDITEVNEGVKEEDAVKTDNLLKAFESCLSPVFTKRDAEEFTKNIAEKVKGAPKHVRKVWDKYEDKIEIGKMSSKNMFYNPDDGKLYLSHARIKKDTDTHKAYEVFFHESAHLFDIKDNKHTFLAHSAVNKEYADTLISEGNAFIEKLADDFLESKLDSFGFKSLSEAKKAGVAVSNAKKLELYENFIDQYEMVDTASIQDMIQGTCGNDFLYQVGHSKTYYNDKDNIPIEAFAEMFSAEMANPNALKLIREIFPKSYEIFKKICKEMTV